MTTERRVLVHPDMRSLAGSVAARFMTKTIDIVQKRGTANIALTGGGMGSAVLAAVTSSAGHNSVDWSRVHFWWGDERWLERQDPERNEFQARAALLDQIPVPAENIHSFAAVDDGVTLDAAAESYAAELAAHGTNDAPAPRFDITFLGVGPDGHIASLFPSREGIREREKSVIAVRNSPKPPPERLSLTRPILNSSDRIWLVLSGADKASALGLALAGASYIEVPVAGAKGRKRTVFFVDEAAAAEVPESLIFQSY